MQNRNLKPIKNIIFDWGGVLIEDPAPGLVEYCAGFFNVPKDQYLNAYIKAEPLFSKGKITEQQFWSSISADLNKSVPDVESLWYDAFKTVCKPRKEMFDLAADLKEKGYKTAFLSNTEKPAAKYFLEQEYKMFDCFIFSCSEGTVKPEPKIYQIALEKLNALADETVFIDDKELFTSAAKQIGIHAITFKNVAQVKKELSNLSVNIN